MKIYFSLLFLFITTNVFSQQNNRALGDQYLANFEYDKAAAVYEKEFERDPYGVYPNYLKCLLALKEYDDAEKLVKKIIKRNPSFLFYQVDLGYVYEVGGEAAKSRQVYEKLIKSLPADQNQVMMVANSFISRQNWDYALITYLEGKRLLSGYYSFYFETAEMYFQKQDYEKMIEEYLGAVSENAMYAQNVQNILQARIGNDPDNSRTDLVRKVLLRRIQREPNQTVFSEMLIWLFVQQKDFESAFLQARMLDKRLNEDGSRIMSLGDLSESNKDYSAAIKCFEYVIQKGNIYYYYLKARMRLLQVRNKRLYESNTYTKTDLEGMEKEYVSALAELGKTASTAPLAQGLAHLYAFYLDKTDNAIDLLEEIIDLPGISKQNQAECKLELGDIFLFSGNVWDSDLLYAQVDKVFKNDPLGHEAKFRSARLDYFRGDFDWALAQLDVLKSSTSQLIANDALALSLLIDDNPGPDSSYDALLIYSKADLMQYRNKLQESVSLLDSLYATFPEHSLIPQALYKKAGIEEEQRLFHQADSLYAYIVSNYSTSVVADDALFARGRLAQNQLNDKVAAMQYYQDLLQKYPGSLYVVDARKQFRILRGDFNN